MAIKSIKLPNGNVIEVDEWLHYPPFSTMEFASTVAPNLRLFTYVVGQRVPSQGIAPRNATESDTNQTARARANHDEGFIFFNVTYETWALSTQVDTAQTPNTLAPAPMLFATNLSCLRRDLMVDLFVGAGITKPMARCTFSYVGQGVGSPGWGGGDAPAANQHPNYGTGGRVSPLNQRRWNLPVMVEGDRVMFLQVHSPVGAIVGLGQDVRLRFYLDGLKRRPIA